MPQLDKYIFLNQVLALIFFFFLTYIYIRSIVIPNLNMSLKYRHKKFASLYSHDRGNWRLFKAVKKSWSRRAITQLTFVTSQINDIFNQFKNKYNQMFIKLINNYYISKYMFVLLTLQLIQNELSTSSIWFLNNLKIKNFPSLFLNPTLNFFSQEFFFNFLIKENIRTTFFINK